MSPANESADASPRTLWYPIVRRLAEQDGQSPFDFLGLGSKQNLTHHFKVLRESGLIQSRYEGRKKFVWLRRELLDEMFPGLLDGLLRAVPAGKS